MYKVYTTKHLVPDRRVQEHQVRQILTSKMLDVIKIHKYLYHPMNYVCDNDLLIMCMHAWTRKSQAKHPNQGYQAKRVLWKESEGIYKQPTQQKRATQSVYYEYGDILDQLAQAPATRQQFKHDRVKQHELHRNNQIIL